MNTPKPLFPKLDRPARVIVLMSGSGSNAEVLVRASRMENSPFTISALVTDRPERCRAREIAAMYHLPLVECDIFDFYRKNGENSIRLDTPRRRELRNRWNTMLEKAIEYLESGEVVLYAVGYAHLFEGGNGLVDTLREAGYTVEQVTYAQ